MSYITKIQFNDSDYFVKQNINNEENDESYISNVKVKESTSINDRITIGKAASNSLYFDISNPLITAMDGMKITLHIQDKDSNVESPDDVNLSPEEMEQFIAGNKEEAEPEEDDSDILNNIEIDINNIDTITDVIEAPPTGEDIEEEEVVEDVYRETNPNTRDELFITYDDLGSEEEIEIDEEGITEDDSEPIGVEGWEMFGEYFVTKITSKDDSIYSIEAQDGFALMNEVFETEGETVGEVYQDIKMYVVDVLGLKISDLPTDIYDDLPIEINVQYTLRELIGYIAGLIGCYATFNRYGCLEFRNYAYNDVSVSSNDLMGTGIQTKTGTTIKIDKIDVDTDITVNEHMLTVDSTGNTDTDIANGCTLKYQCPFMTQEILNTVVAPQYINLEYLPGTVECLWNSDIETGDIISVFIDEENSEQMLVTNMTVDFGVNTVCKIDSLGNTETAQSSKITGPTTRVIERVSAKFDTLIAEKATIEDLQATNAQIDTLKAKDTEISNLLADKASIDDLTVTNETVENLKVAKADITALNATNAEIENLKAKDIEVGGILANKADISDLNAVNAEISNLNTKYVTIDLANIDKASVGTLFADVGLITSANIVNGHITGYLDSVEVNANNITAGTLTVDRLVINGSNKSLVYAINNMGELVSSEVNTIDGNTITKRTITADHIVAGSITSNEIHSETITGDKLTTGAVTSNKIQAGAVTTDKLQVGAIGGFNLSSNAIYSGDKSIVTSNSKGIFLGNDGQMSVGDGNNYIKYYKGSGGEYKLEFASDSFVATSENVDINGDLQISGDVTTSKGITANYISISDNSGTSMFEKSDLDKIVYDTGWVDCTLASGFENYADDQVLKVRRIGDLVEIRGAVKTTKNIAGSSNMAAVITGLDDVFIPSQRIVTSSVGTGLNMQMFTVYPNGNVTLVRYINMKDGSYTTVTNAMWIQLQASWIGKSSYIEHKYFKCDVCDESFNSQLQLNNHYQQAHM